MEALFMVGMLIAFFWLMAILFSDFGPIVIVLFFTVLGDVVLAIMTLIDIRSTWRPLALFFGCSVGMAMFIH